MKYQHMALIVPVLFAATGIAGGTKTAHTPSGNASDKPVQTTKDSEHKPAEEGHWSYDGEATGPDQWGALSDDFIFAEIGTCQSPVDIRVKDAVEGNAPELKFEAGECTIDAVNNGHTIQFNCKGAGTLTVGGEEFMLVQFHYHAPSEHTFNGRSKPVEIHFVHASDSGQLAVVGVMLESGTETNETYEHICNRLPAFAGDSLVNTETTFSPYDLLPENTAYFNYAGSLTTPPCSEGVRWFVLKQPIELSKAQVKDFTDRYTGNNRPVQPLNARLVIVTDGE